MGVLLSLSSFLALSVLSLKSIHIYIWHISTHPKSSTINLHSTCTVQYDKPTQYKNSCPCTLSKPSESGTWSDQKLPADARTFCRTLRTERNRHLSVLSSPHRKVTAWVGGSAAFGKSGYKHIKTHGTYHGQLQTLYIPSQLHREARSHAAPCRRAVRSTHASLAAARWPMPAAWRCRKKMVLVQLARTWTEWHCNSFTDLIDGMELWDWNVANKKIWSRSRLAKSLHSQKVSVT